MGHEEEKMSFLLLLRNVFFCTAVFKDPTWQSTEDFGFIRDTKHTSEVQINITSSSFSVYEITGGNTTVIEEVQQMWMKALFDVVVCLGF